MSTLPRQRRFYLTLSLLVTAIAFVGFWPSYFGPLLAGTVQRPAVIHFHATVYVGWLAIFIAQAWFAATRRMALHLALGNIGIGYGVLVILVGLLAAFSMFAARVQAGAVDEAQTRLLAPLFDMVVFTPLFAAAVYYRRRPEWHKRLMVVATTMLLIAAVARMPFLGTPRNVWLIFLLWSSPLLLAIAYDLARRRFVHPIFVLGLMVLALRLFGAQTVRATAVWQGFTRWLTPLVS